ncbi:MAG: hypothetical protein AAGE84_22395 [Cyanobacteria bacterium P01_G01_bin.39]
MILIALSGTEAQAASVPPQELERLEYFLGTWRCRQPADSNDPSSMFTWKVELGLNDFWYLGNAKQAQSTNNKQPINSQEFMGYDVAANELIRSVVVGNGNSYQMTASDWSTVSHANKNTGLTLTSANKQLVWSGTLIRDGESTPLRQEITQNSPNKFTATYFVSTKKQQWIPVVDEICERQK